MSSQVPRKVRVSTVCFLPPTPTTPAKNLAFYAEKVELAGRRHADIVCLGETINYVYTDRKADEVAEPIPGPSTAALGEAARRGHLWIVASLYEREGKRVYNTAVLIDRQGKLVGRYRNKPVPAPVRGPYSMPIRGPDCLPFDTAALYSGEAIFAPSTRLAREKRLRSASPGRAVQLSSEPLEARSPGRSRGVL